MLSQWEKTVLGLHPADYKTERERPTGAALPHSPRSWKQAIRIISLSAAGAEGRESRPRLLDPGFNPPTRRKPMFRDKETFALPTHSQARGQQESAHQPLALGLHFDK